MEKELSTEELYDLIERYNRWGKHKPAESAKIVFVKVEEDDKSIFLEDYR